MRRAQQQVFSFDATSATTQAYWEGAHADPPYNERLQELTPRLGGVGTRTSVDWSAMRAMGKTECSDIRGFWRQALSGALATALSLTLLAAAGCGTGVTTSGSGSTVLPVSFQTLSLPQGTAGVAYSSAILAQNGTAPYSFRVISGSLPAGITLASTGVLAGTPATVASGSLVVQVTDASSATATETLTLTIAAPAANPPVITTATLPSGTMGVAYTATLAATSGTAPYTFSIATGALPAGLTLSSAGAITGSPTSAGVSTFTAKVTDASGLTGTANLSIAIAAAPSPLSIATATLPNGIVGTAYSATVTANNGTAPYSFAVTTGSLPAGITLASNGVLSGSPTTPGNLTFTLTVTDSKSQTASATFTVGITAAVTSLTVTTTLLPGAQLSVPYQATLAAAGGTAPYAFTVTSGALPAGITLGADGLLKGTPTGTGTCTFTATVTDAQKNQASQPLSIAVTGAGTLAISTTSLPSGTYAVAYTAAIASNGGTAPYSFLVSGGQLPAGLTLASNGVLSGSPIVGDASSTFTVTVTDAAGSHASATYTIAIAYTGPAALSILTTLPTALVNTSYTASLTSSGGTAPYTYTLIGGTLPTGITLNSAGTLSGASTAPGTYTFTVRAADSGAPQLTATASIQLVVASVSATVMVNTAKPLLTVPANFYELHTSVYDTSLNDTANLPTLLAQTGVTVLRYPGGGYSDNYHWAQYAITPFYTTTSPACSVMQDGVLEPDGDFGTFVRLLKAANTEAMITVDYGNSVANASGSKTTGTDGRNTCSEPNTYGQPEEAAAWVAYANGSASSTQVIGVDSTGFDWKTVGFWAGLRAANPLAIDDGYNFLRLGLTTPVGIKYWEIGNELYYNGWATNHNAESDNHSPYVYPNGYTPGDFNSRDALDALSPTSYGTNAVAWIQAMKAVDPTIQIGVDFSSHIATDPIPANWNPDLARAVCAGANFDFAIMHYYPGTYLDVQPGELLRLPQADIPFVYSNIQAAVQTYCPAIGSPVKVYLTETSPNGALDPKFPQPALGLFTINDYLSALQAGVGMVGWLELHDGTYLSESETPGPSYYGYQLAHLTAAPGDSLLSTSSTSPYVLAWSTAKVTGGEGLLLINADPNNSALVSVTISGVSVGATATQYRYGVATTQTGSALASTSVPVAGGSFQVKLPPYTATVLLLH
jgi:hypothetical protein